MPTTSQLDVPAGGRQLVERRRGAVGLGEPVARPAAVEGVVSVDAKSSIAASARRAGDPFVWHGLARQPPGHSREHLKAGQM